MATIKEIAEKLNISTSTVSKGLNGAKDISETMRQQILDTAVEIGYTKRGIDKTENRKLCVFIENMDYYMSDDFGFDIVLGFKQAAFKESWAVEVIPISHVFQKNRPYDAFMVSQGFSGSFVCGFTLDDPWMQEFPGTSMPTILLDNYIGENPMVGSVGTDSDEGIELAVRHLVSLQHERIAFINGEQHSMISQFRYNAFVKSMRAHHLSVVPELCFYSDYMNDVEENVVTDIIEKKTTAILCGSDLIAYSVSDICRRLGYDVPKDLSIIGYDDLPSSATCDPPLTTVRQNRIMLGKSSYYILYALINGVSLSRNLLRPTLVVRDSTAAVQ